MTSSEPIRLRTRLLKDGRSSIYLDLYHNGKREYEYLKLYLIPEKKFDPQWEEQIEAYAKEHGLTYLNFLEKTDEIGIDYTKDTFDAGMHLNLSGAEKLSAWLADYLAENTKVSDRRGDAATAEQWQKKIEFYEAMQASQKKQLEEKGSLNSFR